MVHDFDPVLFYIYGDMGVRWYGLSYILGFIACYFLIRWLCQRQKAGMTQGEMISDFITYGALGTILGGRLGYCLFYSPDLFFKVKPDFPFWGVFAVNEGGMASHGGILGLIVACWLFARKSGVNFLYLLDLVAATGPIGIMLGRIANFVNGELLGRPAAPDLPWAVRFPQELHLWLQDDPQKLSAVSPIMERLGTGSVEWMEWINKIKLDPAAKDKVYAGIQKIIYEVQHGNTAIKDALGPLLTPRHPSQLYAAFLEGLLLFLVLFFMWRRPRKPGFIAATGIALYAVVRIFDEHYRLPDAHIGYQLLDLTRGQWLSVGMLVIGLVLMFLWGRSGTFYIPGWGRLQSLKIGRAK